MKMAPRDTGLAILAALIWGAAFPVSAFAVSETPPLFFTFLRFSCAAAFALILPKPDIAWRKLIALGGFLALGQYGLMFIAMSQGLPAGMAAVLVHTQAIFTVVFATALLNERPDVRIILALAVAGAGLVVLMLDRAQAGAILGFVLMILAALSAAAGNIVLKSCGPVDMIRVAVWMSLAPLLPLLGLSLVFENPSPVALVATISGGTIAAALYSAIIATLVAYTIWGRLLVAYTTSQIAPFFLLVPMFGLALSAVALGERISGLQSIGSALILAGLAISVWAQRARVPRQLR